MSETNERSMSTQKIIGKSIQSRRHRDFYSRKEAYIYFIFYEKPLDGNFCRIQSPNLFHSLLVFTF